MEPDRVCRDPRQRPGSMIRRKQLLPAAVLLMALLLAARLLALIDPALAEKKAEKY